MADDAPAADTAAPPNDVNWEKAYLGLPDTVRNVRRDVRAILGPCPETVTDDAVLVASELAANAIRHSRSGANGGTYLVRVSHFATTKLPYVWVEVEDLGSPSWDGILRPEQTHGLSVIQHLSTWMGSDRGLDGRRAVYARLDYQADGTPLYGANVPELPANLDGVRDDDNLAKGSYPTPSPPRSPGAALPERVRAAAIRVGRRHRPPELHLLEQVRDALVRLPDTPVAPTRLFRNI
jgi:anti-sigma regulatory factor (Ser/Thr protein kinase)